MSLYFPVDEHKLTKQEKKELRKLEWQEKAKTEVRNAKLKKLSIWGGVILAILITAGVLYAFVSTPTTQTPNISIAPISSRDISTGNPKAKVVLVEYADFHSLVDQILKDYNGKIFYVYRMFPLEQAHQNALFSAQASYAAYKQGKFFEYGDLLFQNQNDWATLQDPSNSFISYAQSLKLDINKFKIDMNSQSTQKYVKDSENEGSSEGIYQTPSFFINGKMIQNPTSYADFKKLIDAALSK
jgi:protein-disulfide isomerase